MRLRSFLLAFGLASASAFAQTTTITASNEKAGGVPIALGTVTFIGTNVRGVAIPFTDASGGNQPGTYSCTIVNGAITGALGADGTTITGPCVVPDSAQTTPANIDYVVQVCDGSSGVNRCYPSMLVPFVTGTTFALDHFAPSAQTASSTAMQAAIGTAVPSTCVAPAIFTLTSGSSPVIYTCVAGAYVAASSPSGPGASLTTAQQQTLASALTTANVGSTVAPLVNNVVPMPNLPASLPADAQAAQNAMSAVNTEVTNRTAAVTGETSRATSAEGTNASAIGTETTSRTAAVSGEAATRSSADTTNATNTSYAQAAAGALSPAAYGITCNGTLSSTTLGQLITYTAAGAAGDSALTSTLAAIGSVAGSSQTGPTIGIQTGNYGNLPQGLLTLPQGKVCTAVGPILLPPGAGFNTNHSVLFITGAGHGLYIKNNGPNGNYGAHKNRIFGGGVIIGPGVGNTQGDGLLTDVGVNVDISDVNFYQFKHGVELANFQYSTMFNVWGAHNEIGLVINSTTVSDSNGNTVLPTQGVTMGSLQSIDDTIWGGGWINNSKAGLWNPAGALVRLVGVSRSWNDHMAMVIGPMPPPYLSVKGYAVTAPGATCTSTLTTAIGNNGTVTPIAPMTISAPGSGATATGFVTLSAASGGTVTGAYGINPGGAGGTGYTAAPTITVPACTSQPTITATIINDQITDPQGQYASTVGTTVDDTGDFEGNGFRSDGVSQRPAYGSSVLFNTGSGSYDLRRPFFGYTPQGDGFTRFVTNYGSKNEVEYPQGQAAVSPIVNASGASDACMVVSSLASGIISKWGLDDGSANRSCDVTYTPLLSSNGAYQGFYQGSTAANGFVSLSNSAQYGLAYAGKLPSDVAFRFQIGTDGHYRKGDGTNGTSGIGSLGYAGFTLGTGGANSTASPAVASTGGTFALDSDTYYTNMPFQWQPGVGGNYSIPLTGDVNNFLTVYNRTTGSGQWYATSSGITFNGTANTFGFVLNSCAQSSTKGVCTSPQNFFNVQPSGTTVPGVLPTTLYSAAGTAIPACVAALLGETTIVKDATSPTYLGAYTSGGTITVPVVCSTNSSVTPAVYSWLTH